MTALPLVSVIVPAHNGQRFTADALDTVLAQSYRHIEVLVVDDGNIGSGSYFMNITGVSCIRHESERDRRAMHWQKVVGNG